MLIDATPPAALQDWRYLLTPAAAAGLTFLWHPAIGRLERLITVFDAFGLALFCVTGALKALEFGISPAGAALMGMITGIGGGILRDLLVGRVPMVFQGDLYATPALAGAVVVVVGSSFDQSSIVLAIIGGGMCLVWRLLAIWRDWRAPLPSGPASV